MQNEEPSIVGDIIFDICHPHIPLNGVETLDVLGISCYESIIDTLSKTRQ
jgi:hypothetical protein